MSILQNIFRDHYEELIYILHPRPYIIENLDKMTDCNDPSFGGAMYNCPHCGKLKFVPFRCHNRFCPTCGNIYSIQRTASMFFKLVNVIHGHCVFNINEQLRNLLLHDRSLIDYLFHTVNNVISCMFFNQNNSMNLTSGFIMVLHTLVRYLKRNPHIHCLISECGYSNNELQRNSRHFNYIFLRNSFHTTLFNEMKQ